MGPTAYIARRLAYGVILLIGVLVLNFFLIHAAPGDPAETIAGAMGGATARMLADIRSAYGLDKPLRYLWQACSIAEKGHMRLKRIGHEGL